VRNESTRSKIKINIPENTVDVFEAYTQLVLEGLGLTVKFVDSWFYHTHAGGIHCATNVMRTTDAATLKTAVAQSLNTRPASAGSVAPRRDGVNCRGHLRVTVLGRIVIFAAASSGIRTRRTTIERERIATTHAPWNHHLSAELQAAPAPENRSRAVTSVPTRHSRQSLGAAGVRGMYRRSPTSTRIIQCCQRHAFARRWSLAPKQARRTSQCMSIQLTGSV
jgi:hypothetical protein